MLFYQWLTCLFFPSVNSYEIRIRLLKLKASKTETSLSDLFSKHYKVSEILEPALLCWSGSTTPLLKSSWSVLPNHLATLANIYIAWCLDANWKLLFVGQTAKALLLLYRHKVNISFTWCPGANSRFLFFRHSADVLTFSLFKILMLESHLV